MVDTWKEIAFKDEVAALGTATPAATDGSAASAGSATAASKSVHNGGSHDRNQPCPGRS